MKKIFVFILLLFIFLSGSCSDRYTKNWAKKSLENNQTIVLIDKYLELRYTENNSMGFSLLTNIDLKFRKQVIIILQTAVIIFLFIYMYKLQNHSFFTLLPFIIILSGAAGNLIDRLQQGYVVDFIYLHINNKFKWPIFNIADILICIGAGLLLLEMLYNRKILNKKLNEIN